MKDLIWTRSRSDWQEDLGTITKLISDPQIQVVHSPCIELTPTRQEYFGETFDVAIITSANVLRFASDSVRAILSKCSHIYTHGTKTAALAAAHGLEQIITVPARTGDELIQALLPRIPHGSRVFLPSAEQPASDLSQILRNAGHEALALPIYRTISAACRSDGSSLTAEDIKSAQDSWTGVVCFASPSAVKAFHDAYTPQANRLGRCLVAIALGPTTAKACVGHYAKIELAAGNTIEALVIAAQQALSAQPEPSADPR